MKKEHKVLVAGAQEDLRLALEQLAEELPGVAFSHSPQRALSSLNGKAVSSAVIVVDIDVQSASAVDDFFQIARSVPGGKVIAAARNASGEDVRRLFRGGAADVLTAPFTPVAFRHALDEVLEMTSAARGRDGKVVALVKACGGAGATTIALNLAILAARGEGKAHAPMSTALLDLDLQFGCTDVALNLEPRSSLLDVLRAEHRFDARFLETVMSEHRSGLKLLPPPPSMLPLDAMSAPFAVELLEQSARMHALTVVDMPDAWTDWTFPALTRSDLIVLVATPTVTSVMGARRALDALRSADVSTPVLLVVNKLGGLIEAMDRPDRIGRALDLTVEGAFGFDPSAPRAADKGVVMVEAFPKSRLARELRGFSAVIHRKLTPARTAEPSLGAAA